MVFLLFLSFQFLCELGRKYILHTFGVTYLGSFILPLLSLNGVCCLLSFLLDARLGKFGELFLNSNLPIVDVICEVIFFNSSEI